jgi:hypothetical protein
MRSTDATCAAIRRILTHDWDPIGISSEVSAQDEYDVYLSPIAEMLRTEKSTAEISAYLYNIETNVMGLVGDLTRARRVADLLRGI